jgi:FkbM family methyltransferase
MTDLAVRPSFNGRRSFRSSRILCTSLVVAFLCVLALGFGCDGTAGAPTTDSSSASNSSIESPANSPHDTAPSTKAKTRSFQQILDDKAAENRAAAGREGILAEERLYSNFDEELIIRDFFQDKRGGVFLDVGCARAIKGSNTYYLEKHLGWTGIGVDALEEYAAEWKQMRPNSRFRSHLVSDRSGGTETFFKSFGRGLSSTNEESARGKAFGEDFPTEELQLQTITLNDLLAQEGVSKIDLLSMDIEGHELKALAGFDIERLAPELIVIEMQVHPGKNRQVAQYFWRHGYRRIEKYRAFDSVNAYYGRKKH